MIVSQIQSLVYVHMRYSSMEKVTPTLFVFTLLIFNSAAAYGVPGVKSIKQCHKYYDMKFSLRDLDFYTPMTQEDIEWIIKEEYNETVPTWVTNPFEDFNHKMVATGNNSRNFPYTVGGVNAFSWECPFMAALGFDGGSNIEYDCGGSLISENYVITAAHCIFSGQREPVKYVRLGNAQIRTNNSMYVQVINVATYYIHPNYTFSEKYNDIAIIKLAKPATFNKFVKPICLEYERKSLRYKILYAAGWGLLGYGEERSNILQKVALRLHALKDCRKTYGKDLKLPNGIVDDMQICAGSLIEANVTDTCEGDSGGPLLYIGKRFEKVKYLTGITSFGVPCGIAPLPAIYTRVAYYIDWIENIVWPDEKIL